MAKTFTVVGIEIDDTDLLAVKLEKPDGRFVRHAEVPRREHRKIGVIRHFADPVFSVNLLEHDSVIGTILHDLKSLIHVRVIFLLDLVMVNIFLNGIPRHLRFGQFNAVSVIQLIEVLSQPGRNDHGGRIGNIF